MKRNEFLKRLLGAGAAAAISNQAITTTGKELPEYNKNGGDKKIHFEEKDKWNGKEVSGVCSYKYSG